MWRVKIIAVLGLLALCGSVAAMEGSGTETDPYIITNVEELQAMQDDLGAYYVLGNDIDACETRNWNGGAGFEPIGNEVNGFTGIFDGQAHVITGLYIKRPDTDGVGLFGCIRDNAVIKEVGLADVNVTARRNSGPLVGTSSGATVCNSWSTGIIQGSYDYQMRLGGLIGLSSGANSFVSQCFSDVTVIASGGAHQVGGLAGYNGHGSVMSDCYATGDVTGSWKVGGLVGDNIAGSEGTLIERCYSAGRVTGIGGGLVGYNWQGGVTYDSYWDIQTSGKSSSYGGTGKTTAEMMQQSTFANWDFDEIWVIEENESCPFLRWELSGSELAIIDIRNAIGKKQAALEMIDAALVKEGDACDALGELLKSGDYGNLKKRDIIKARWQIRLAMHHQRWFAKALEKSIEKLEDALATLGWEPQP
jgi:hypothetical protein